VDERIKILNERKLELEEQLIKMVAIAEAQIRTIKLVTGFPDVFLSPQIEAIEEARKVLGEATKWLCTK